MTDIRALIAETLRTHYLWPEGQDGSEHLADVLLSLPGIAVVDRRELLTMPYLIAAKVLADSVEVK